MVFKGLGYGFYMVYREREVYRFFDCIIWERVGYGLDYGGFIKWIKVFGDFNLKVMGSNFCL